ncbi:hypothetical protein LTR16_003198 [Cryomyces antarcticus]|uniref:Uncharacterized protein n=1 Tax=Cryomyces antarcticus TaxID=329879 RepID=A0ABR0LY92_9PEZI|nr:hypothetical protein LTR39_002442 [Cryomyces antarcticus]KAK5016467.1 hypothetical protein LTR60_002387 [Cryomyces antarcticus]KAK5256471.1 hypothetical protein LTR16_003198 [Cryomyces antarcticus]
MQGLRKAVTEEKKKRKRGKAMGLLEKGENAGQPLFFSPFRVGRARQQAADEAQAEQQRKQAIQDRRLQSATRRVERAHEVEGRKAARVAARKIAEEERARKKAEQAARKAAQQAKATKRHQNAAIRKGQSTVAKEAKESAAKSKKRCLVEEEVVAPRKRPCAKFPTQRNKQKASSLRITLGSPEREAQNNATSSVGTSGSPLRRQVAGWVLVPQRLRSGRNTKPPLRYQ